MRFFPLFSLFQACLLSLCPGQAPNTSPPVEDSRETEYDFRELKVGSDLVLKNCRVSRRETDALIVSHEGGIARVSLFDVNADIQKQYDFDPVAALQKYRRDREMLEAQRKERFLAAEKFKAQEAARLDEVRKYEIAEKLWIPATGNVLKRTRLGTFVRAYEITFVPTKAKSTLGFTIDGPPKKVMKPFDSGVVCLRGIHDKVGSKWKGYINPICLERVSRNPEDPPVIAVHEAVALKEK